MNSMQAELDAASTSVPIQLGGINQAGVGEAFAESFGSATTLPYLQDTSSVDVYASWGASKDDLFIVGPDGLFAGYYDLGVSSLDNQATYDAIKQALIDLANSP